MAIYLILIVLLVAFSLNFEAHSIEVKIQDVTTKKTLAGIAFQEHSNKRQYNNDNNKKIVFPFSSGVTSTGIYSDSSGKVLSENSINVTHIDSSNRKYQNIKIFGSSLNKKRFVTQMQINDTFSPAIVNLRTNRKNNIKDSSSSNKTSKQIPDVAHDQTSEKSHGQITFVKLPNVVNGDSNDKMQRSHALVKQNTANKRMFRAECLKNHTDEAKCSCQSQTCKMRHCCLRSVPNNLPNDIIILELNFNIIQELKTNDFVRYQLLEYLDLSNNNIGVIEDGAFNDLSQLTYLDISYNYKVTQIKFVLGVFDALTSLKVLKMNGNIKPCPTDKLWNDTVLAPLYKLEELHIDNYINPDKQDGFGPIFRNMTSLRNLKISCVACQMKHLRNITFTNVGQILFLNISDCGINGSNIETGTFSNLTFLQTLDISKNPDIGMQYLPVILGALNNSDLQTLIMNSIVEQFSLTFLNSSHVEYLPKTLTAISARKNNILTIDPKTLTNLPKHLNTIDISENFIMTNPETLHLYEMNELKTLVLQQDRKDCLNDVFLDHYFSKNAYPGKKTHEERFIYDSVENLQDRFVPSRGNVTFQIPQSLRAVNITIDNINEKFLQHIDPNNSIYTLDLSCSYLYKFKFYDLKNFPNLRYLNIRRSIVRELVTSLVMPSLNTLILESNLLNDYINTVQHPFKNFTNLTDLDLSTNQIIQMPNDFLVGLNNLEDLRLTGNPFVQFDVNISHMSKLNKLDIGDTILSTLPNHVRLHIDNLSKVKIQVNMAHCPIQCDCFNLDFLQWMVNSPAFEKHFINYKCRYTDTSIRYINDSYKQTIHDLERECNPNFPLFLIVLTATLLLICCVIGLILYRLRWKIRYLYYAAYLKFTDKLKNDNHQEYAYDVFLSYDSEDQEFVSKKLAPELEQRGIRLLIHGRDFVSGQYISANIVMAVHQSRKMLVVLTRHLMNSTWCDYELQMAIMESVHTGREVLVFLLKEKIPSREIRVELLHHIRSNTYLPYPEPEVEDDHMIMGQFYDKLARDLKS